MDSLKSHFFYMTIIIIFKDDLISLGNHNPRWLPPKYLLGQPLDNVVLHSTRITLHLVVGSLNPFHDIHNYFFVIKSTFFCLRTQLYASMLVR